MQLKRLITLLCMAAMAIIPLQSIAVQKTITKPAALKVVKTVENKTKKITEKTKKSEKEKVEKLTKKATQKLEKNIDIKKTVTPKKEKIKKKLANDKKIANAKKTMPKVNETKKLYGVKGAKLAPTKVANKVYSYREKGKTYTSIAKEPSRLFTQTGVASYYGGMFHGRKTANGEIFNKNAYTAAHKTLALGSYALVTNLRNGRQVIVRINDRGPFSHNRIIDLSVAAAREIGMLHSGISRVKIEAMQVDRQGYISGKGAEALYKLAKREGLNLKVKGKGKDLAIKAE